VALQARLLDDPLQIHPQAVEECAHEQDTKARVSLRVEEVGLRRPPDLHPLCLERTQDLQKLQCSG